MARCVRRPRQRRLARLYCAVQHKVVKAGGVCHGHGQHDTGNNVAQRPRSAAQAHVGPDVGADAQAAFWAAGRSPAATGFQWERRSNNGLDIANAALFLASDEARFITGVDFPVDGGRTI